MEKFARIIETKKGQVLLTKEWNDEDQSHEIKVRFSVEGMQLSASFGYKENEENKRDEMFEGADERWALAFMKNLPGIDTLNP